jgi:signal transduction histidine kinase
MAPKITSLILVGMNPPAAAIAREAARQCFPDATVGSAPSVAAALEKPEAVGVELLLLDQPAPAAVAQAIAAVDRRGWPRWPVVVFGAEAGSGRASILSPEDWTAARASRAFQAAEEFHRLACENARLRGDLRTIGRRWSHDLRTPLMGISTAGEAIRETLPEDTDSREAFTQSIGQGADEIIRLIERLGAVLKASAEAKMKEPVAMGEIVWAARQRLERRLQGAGATVTEPASWPAVAGVASWLEIIWGNLVANALEHAGPSPHIELGWQEEPGGCRFWTEDRGPGVSARANGGLFQPFDLLHRPNAPRGWGLAIVQRLVELQGGRCGYEPRPGGGARFFFTLPG